MSPSSDNDNVPMMSFVVFSLLSGSPSRTIVAVLRSCLKYDKTKSFGHALESEKATTTVHRSSTCCLLIFPSPHFGWFSKYFPQKEQALCI